MGFFQNTCFRERSQMVVTPKLWVTVSLYEKESLPVITHNKNQSPKQVVSMISTLGKDFFAAVTF